jgi:F5/8 type C domain
MKYRAAWGAVGLVVVAALACVPEPVRKANGDGGGLGSIGGTINVSTGGDGGDTGTPMGTAGTVGGGGDAGATGLGGDPATGTGGDPTGAGGTGDTTGAAGAGIAGSTAAGGTAGSGGQAGSGGPAGAGGTHTGGTGGGHAGGSGGSAAGGTGGTPAPVSPCNRTSWTFTPSVVCTTNCAGMADAQRLPSNAIDGDVNTRYTTGIKQGSAGPESVVLTFTAPVTISGVSLYAKATTDAPNMYKVEYSTDGATFMAFAPPLAGPGLTTLLIPFAKTQLRAIRVTQTGVWPHWWSVNEMTVVGCSAQ